MQLADHLETFVALENRKRELEAQVKEIKEEQAQISEVLIDAMLDADIQSFKVSGKTVYLHSQIWAKVEDKDKAMALLQETGYGDLVKPTYNSNQLSALVRELGEDLPEEWEGVIEANPVVSVRMRG